LNLLKQKERVYSDTELSLLQKNHEYNRRKLILDFLSSIFVISVTIVSIVFFYEFIMNESLRSIILSKITENIIGIVFFSLAMFGIKNKI